MSVSQAAAQFERQYAEYRRSKTVWTVLFWALFAVCFVVSLLVTRFDVVALAIADADASRRAAFFPREQ